MTVSPMMQQYHSAKEACPDALLLFRMGDFYELFFDDARETARILGLTLTSRDKGENPIPMAGFPHHQLENYLAKLIAAGCRAAICEQVEDPRQAKGLVKRELTRVVTPGTVTDDALLDPRQSNFLAAVWCKGKQRPGTEVAGLAWVELSLGKFLAAEVPLRTLSDELARIRPAECLLADGAAFDAATFPDEMLLTRRPDWVFNKQTAQETLSSHFGAASLEGFGFSEQADSAVAAAGAILHYLQETQRASLEHIDRLIPYRCGDCLEIDQATRRSLEIARTMREGRREGSLLAAIDRTATAMGSRLLADWVDSPLTDVAAIEARHEAAAELLHDAGLCDFVREQFAGVYDVQRLLARVSTGRATPRDLSFLGRTLQKLPALKARLTARRSSLLNQLEERIDLCPELRSRLDAGLQDDCPLVSREGGFIRSGYSAELDGLRELAQGGKQWIAQYQAREIERTGISSLKVGFNKVFGYYLEITNTHRERIPPEYIRKQTVKNAERFITPDLKEYEEKVLSADEKAKELEHDLFLQLREAVGGALRRLLGTADALAQLDVLCGLAVLARQRNYCRPAMRPEPILRIIDGRHPVLDLTEAAGAFVPNDIEIDDERRILLITGPNMAGKSTYIRQAALIVLLAQIGSFVPAREAEIGVADRIFARVGASDELSRGQSTFMVEMTETARILHNATPRSLVILDEIGRGTSTYDGLALAWSVVEHLHDRVACRTLFATHYHELTDLARSLPGLKNLNVAVREWDEEVVFLHKIIAGAADKSYGIHVARLAGVPRDVVQRAKDILWELEQRHVNGAGELRLAPPTAPRRANIQLTLFDTYEHPLLEQLRQLNLDALAPMEALMRLKSWQEELKTQQARRGKSKPRT